MVSGPEPFRSVRLLSTDANTVKTSTKVMISSTPNACSTVRASLTVVMPSEPRTVDGVSNQRRPAPARAPPHWAAMKSKPRMRLMRRVTRKATVTAGLT